jgi:hypothetical protein
VVVCVNERGPLPSAGITRIRSSVIFTVGLHKKISQPGLSKPPRAALFRMLKHYTGFDLPKQLPDLLGGKFSITAKWAILILTPNS